MREPVTASPRLAAVPSLDEIANGQPLDDLAAPVISALYERVAVTEARLRARLLTRGLEAVRPPANEPDRVLGIDDAAPILGMSVDFLYRNWAKLGLGYKDADGHVKFPLSKVQRHIRLRTGR